MSCHGGPVCSCLSTEMSILSKLRHRAFLIEQARWVLNCFKPCKVGLRCFEWPAQGHRVSFCEKKSRLVSPCIIHILCIIKQYLATGFTMPQPFIAPSKMSIFLAYVAGLAYWVSYFVKGKPTFTGNDWLKEQVFSNLVRDSLNSWQLPWRMSVDFYHSGVFELIANPEISLTPDFLLLAWLPNNTYFLVHWLLFFTAGFVGSVLLARKYALSSLPFLFFVVLFNFNGFISSHISEGHIQWAGYFLFPLFFYWLSDIAAEMVEARTSAALKIALLLGVMFINGSFHMAIWCLMLMALTLTYRRDLWRPVGLVVSIAGLL